MGIQPLREASARRLEWNERLMQAVTRLAMHPIPTTGIHIGRHEPRIPIIALLYRHHHLHQETLTDVHRRACLVASLHRRRSPRSAASTVTIRIPKHHPSHQIAVTPLSHQQRKHLELRMGQSKCCPQHQHLQLVYPAIFGT